MLEQWLLINGFSKDGKIYIVAGGNTYSIKDELKENGFRFNKLLGWYSSEIKPVPANYSLVMFTFDELFVWEDKYKQVRPYLDIKERIAKKVKIPQKISNYEFLNKVGERFYNLPVEVKRIQTKMHNYKNYYIYHYIYNNTFYLTWTTNKKLNINIGQKILLTGTITSHYLYYGKKINKINRCIINLE